MEEIRSPHHLIFSGEDAATTTERLTRLAYELVDAHEDTTRLVCEQASMLEWQVHVDYLQALQRMTKATLARL